MEAANSSETYWHLVSRNIDPHPTKQAANLMLLLLTKEVAKGDCTLVQCVPTQIKYLQYIRLQFNASPQYDFVQYYWSS